MHVEYRFENPAWLLTWTQMPEDQLPKAEERTPEEVKKFSSISRPGYGAIYHGERGQCMHWGGDGGTWAERKVRNWQPPAGTRRCTKAPGTWRTGSWASNRARTRS